MSFKKSDILHAGFERSKHNDGTLAIYAYRFSSADLFCFRSILSLFGAEIVSHNESRLIKGPSVTPAHSYFTNLAFSELDGLDAAESFPKMVAAQREAAAIEKAKQDRIDAIKTQEDAVRDKQATRRGNQTEGRKHS